MDYSREILEAYFEDFNKVISFLNHEMGLPSEVNFHDGIITNHEGYKFRLSTERLRLLRSDLWEEASIGDGSITEAVRSAMRAKIYGKPHNLVDYRDKDEFDRVVDADIKGADRLFYNIFCGENDGASFEEAVLFFGQKFPIISYLFYIKDCSEYVPARPNNFSARFKKMGINTRCLNICSWENYNEFNSILEEIRLMLVKEYFDDTITLLDAHTFAWMGWLLDKSNDELRKIASETGVTALKRIEESKTLEKMDDDDPVSRDNRSYDFEYESYINSASLIDGPDTYEYGDVRPKPPVIEESENKGGAPKYKRDPAVAKRALAHAAYSCECDSAHPTFLRRNSDRPYTESHHLIPMQYSGQFDYSLDTEVNIVSLCSNCHNMIHYGKDADKLIEALYEKRAGYLAEAGIGISSKELLKLYGY